jgi:metal-responsive CopG/Arc/MetJ family transcriptional regulator
MLYIVMERTQIYLSEQQTRELDRRARQRGTTRSHLIREAVDEYLRPVQDPVEFKAALDAVAGMAADRDITADYLELKRRNREKLRHLWAPDKVVLDEDEIARR